MIVSRQITLVLVPRCVNHHRGGRAQAVTFQPGEDVEAISWPCGCVDSVEWKLRQVLVGRVPSTLER